MNFNVLNIRIEVPGGEWDSFAQDCQASFRCSKGYLASKRTTHRVHCFSIYDNDERVGQCAVAEPRIGKRRVFLDSILLKSAYQSQWGMVMQRILSKLGSGTYVYGSPWNLEGQRDSDLRGIPGVNLRSSDAYHVQFVDFSTWPDWPDYYNAISQNAKRNATKARKTDPGIRIKTITGLPSPSDLKRMFSMRRDSFRRKSVQLKFWILALLRRIIILRHYSRLVWVIFHNHYTAFAYCARFGDNLYYTDGASIPNNGGSAWHLMIELLHEHHLSCPDGKFFMGFTPVFPWENARGWDNVLRQRQQCKVTASITSIITFNYDPH